MVSDDRDAILKTAAIPKTTRREPIRTIIGEDLSHAQQDVHGQLTLCPNF